MEADQGREDKENWSLGEEDMLLRSPEPTADGESKEKREEGAAGLLILVLDTDSLSGSRSFLMSWVTRWLSRPRWSRTLCNMT